MNENVLLHEVPCNTVALLIKTLAGPEYTYEIIKKFNLSFYNELVYQI